MAETFVNRVHDEPVVLDIGRDIGALVIYTGPELHGREVEVSLQEPDAKRVHTAIHERRLRDRTIYAGVIPTLPAGDYDVWGDGLDPVRTVTIAGGHVSEVDLRG